MANNLTLIFVKKINRIHLSINSIIWYGMELCLSYDCMWYVCNLFIYIYKKYTY